MKKEEAKDFLIDISYKLGNMAVEYLTEKDGEKMREAIEALEQESKIDWIPVSERLPNKPNVYTVTDNKGDVVRFVFNDTESSREYWLRCAKAWMPLPKSYREDGDTE